MVKVCKDCGLEKPVSEFYAGNRYSKDGVVSWCKDCYRKRYYTKDRMPYYRSLRMRSKKYQEWMYRRNEAIREQMAQVLPELSTLDRKYLLEVFNDVVYDR